MGKVPDDLPDTDLPIATGPPLAALTAVEEELSSDRDLTFNRSGPTITSKDHSRPSPAVPILPSPTTDSDVKSDIPALDHFPIPPVHLPLPRLQRGLTNSIDELVAGPSSYGRQMTSPALPIRESSDLTATAPKELAAVTTTQTPSPTTNKRVETSAYLSTPSRSDPYRTSPSTDLSTTALTTDTTEFGIRQSYPLPSSGSSGSSTLPKESPRSSGVVLAMRNRFAQNVSYNRYAGTIRKVELYSLYLQLRQEKLRLRSLVSRSVCQPSPVVIDPVVSSLHYVRTGLRQSQPLNLSQSTTLPAPTHQ